MYTQGAYTQVYERINIMKKRFIKGVSFATAVCLSVSAPNISMANEILSNNNTYNSLTNTNLDKNDYEVVNSEEGTTVNHNGDINTEGAGILADNNSTVNQTGNVDTKKNAINANNDSSINVKGNINATDLPDDKYSSSSYAIISTEGSSVNVSGDVNSNEKGIISNDGSVDIEGKLSAKVEGVETHGNSTITVKDGIEVNSLESERPDVKGLDAYIGKTTLNGDINVSGKNSKGYSVDGVEVFASPGKNTDVSISGDITVNAKSSDYARSRAIEATTDGNSNISIYVDGNITANSESISDSNVAKSSANGIFVHTQKSGGTVNISVNGNVSANSDTEKLYGDGVGINTNANEECNVKITVSGDVTGTKEGVCISENDGNVDIIVDGTISGKERAIRVSSSTRNSSDNSSGIVTSGETGKLNITVWQLKSDSEQLVKAENIDYTKRTANKTVRTELESTEEEVLKNINYIIRTNDTEKGTIILSGTELINGYNTARESQEIIIRVETSSGYQLDGIKNGSSTLKKNTDGTYSLIVPRGGGVALSAVLSAIKQADNNSSSGSDSDSSGSNSNSNSNLSNPAGTNQFDENMIKSPSGATISRNVSESNGIKSINSNIIIGGKSANVTTSIMVVNGQNTTMRFVDGDISGVTFMNIGTVSADGSSVVTENGQTFTLTTSPILIITSNGQTVGYFVNPITYTPIATGQTEIYYQLGEDGQLYAHWVDPLGFFYTGTVLLNGFSYTFNEEGILLSIS